MKKWIESARFANVILLTSSDSAYSPAFFKSRMEFHLAYISTKPFEKNLDLEWEKIDHERNDPLPEIFFPSHTFAVFLYEELLNSDISLLILTKFTLECPENINEAQRIADQLSYFMGWNQKKEQIDWLIPTSWNGLVVDTKDEIPERLFF